jgi:hypothetical protein
MLLCSGPEADLYEWGWYTINNDTLDKKHIIPNINDWYCRLPHEFDPITYKYFVITQIDGFECTSMSFYNPPVNIDELTGNEVYVFPNPTDGVINIRFNHSGLVPPATLEVYNISGRIVYQSQLPNISSESTVSINETRFLKPGIYFIRIRSKSSLFNSKIVVQ